jgi:hypothetical protein
VVSQASIIFKSKDTESKLIEFYVINGTIYTTMKDKTLLRYSNKITQNTAELCFFMPVGSLDRNKNNRRRILFM